MAPEDARRHSRQLLVLALLALALASVWASRAPIGPNSDRFDYAGRAFHIASGNGFDPLVVYPLRMSLAGAESWPPENLTRPPLWPSLLAPGLRFGVGDRSGVILAAACAGLLLLWLAMVGDQSFGGGAGGMAALAVATSFTVVRGVWGGGPELALAVLTFILWTWMPRGSGTVGHLACGSLYGLLPLLHPVGWMYAGLALLARRGRYERRCLPWLFVGALAVVVPWHIQLWQLTGDPFGLLQSKAELARNLRDPGGLGPYRGLELADGMGVLREAPLDVLRLAAHRLKERLLHLDALLAWPFIALALRGAWTERRLAIRDAGLLFVAFALLAPLTAEPRLLLPLLPVAATWVGVGLAAFSDRRPNFPWALVAGLVAFAPWLLPLGAASRPLGEARAIPPELARPPTPVVDLLRTEGDPLDPFVTDSAHLAFAARRSALFLPDSPATLSRLRERPALRDLELIVLSAGSRSAWTQDHQAEWDHFFARCDPLMARPNGTIVLRLPPRATDGP